MAAGPGGAPAPKDETKHEPVIPAAAGSHQDKEVKLEFGHGTITGEITATFEFGTSGVPLSGDKLTALKNTIGVQLNGFVRKVETALLNGELELGVTPEGLTVSIEASAFEVGTDGKSVDIDLLNVGVKIGGDASSWFNRPGLKVTVDGMLSIALGGKLAKELAEFTATQAAKKAVGDKIASLTPELERHAAELKALEAEKDLLISTGGSGARQAELTELIWKKKLKVSSVADELEREAGKFKKLGAKAGQAMGKLKGKVAKQVARVMETKVMKFVAEKAMKLLPILNAVSLAMDIADVIGMFVEIATGERTRDGDGGEGGKGKKSEESEGSGPDAKPGEKGEASGDGTGQSAVSAQEKAEYEAAKKDLSHPAQLLLQAVERRGLKGPQLTPDQLRMIGLMAADLKQQELPQVLEYLRSQDHQAQTPEELFVAIDRALKEVRNRGAVVKQDGADRPDLARATGPDDGPIVTPGQVEGGAVTSPSQVQLGGDAKDETPQAPPKPLTSADIVKMLPERVVGRWFEASGDDLQFNAEGRQWESANRGANVDEYRLDRMLPIVRNTGPGAWDLEVQFRLMKDQQNPRTVSHHFAVKRGEPPSDFGTAAKVGELWFMGYELMDVHPS